MKTKLLSLFLLSIISAGVSAQCHVSFTWQQAPGTYAFTFTADSVSDQGQGLSGTPTFTWTFSNGVSATGQSVVDTLPALNGSAAYVVCLTMADSITQCNVTVCDTVIVSPNTTGGCSANVTYTNQDSIYIFMAGNQGTPPFTYAWSVNGQAVGAGAALTQVIVDTVAGDYTNVCVTVTDANGCVATNCADVPANSNQGSCSVYGAYTSQDSVYTFVATAIGVGPFVYSWSYNNSLIGGSGDAATLVLDSAALTPNGAVVCVTMTSANGCVASACINIAGNTAGNGPCQAYFQIYDDTLNNGGVDTSGNYYGYNLSTGNYGSNILWNFGDGTTSTNPYPTHTYADSGLYIVCLTVGVAGTSCYSTYCDSSFYVTRAMVLMHQLSIIGPTGISTPLSGTGISVYPNPVSNRLNLHFNEALQNRAYINVTDMLGQTIITQQLGEASENTALDVANLPAGIYLCRVTGNNFNQTIQFIKN